MAKKNSSCKRLDKERERETLKVQLTPASEANERARIALAIALLHLVTWAAFLKIDKAIFLAMQLVNWLDLKNKTTEQASVGNKKS